jgi:hypothetical protein
MPDLSDYLTCAQAARLVTPPCSPVLVRNRCAAGEIPGAAKPGREWLVPRESLAFIRKVRLKAPTCPREKK